MTFRNLLCVVIVLILPFLGASYVLLRRRVRQESFLALFTNPVVAVPYLALHGRRPRQKQGETTDTFEKRVTEECTELCRTQFSGEFGNLHWLFPVLLASTISAIAECAVVFEVFGSSVRPNTPSPVLFALLGGIVWTFYVTFRDYTRTDLSPTAFYWAAFRFILAPALGVLSYRMFTDGVVADVTAFCLAMLPFDEGFRFIRSRVPGLQKEEGTPKLTLIQGLAPENAERLKELGIQTIEHLAYADPLRLLLNSNIPAKVLIDWMDQALLYVYLGDQGAELRQVGIRGAIEAAALADNDDVGDDVIALFSKRVNLDPREFMHLVETLNEDTQAITLLRLWGSLDVEDVVAVRAP